MSVLEKFGNTPLEEPKILEVFQSNDEDMTKTVIDLLELFEERIGEEVDFETAGKIIAHVLSFKDENNNYKSTPKTENIEPLKPKDTVKFIQMVRSGEKTQEELFEWLKGLTNVPDDLTQWEKVLVIEQILAFGLDGMKTVLGGALGN